MRRILQFTGVVLGVIAVWTVMFSLLVFGNRMFAPREIVINCSIAEISPDFTPEMREACRRYRINLSKGNTI
jgi:hypothetical protein